jgi:hypothetical protein
VFFFLPNKQLFDNNSKKKSYIFLWRVFCISETLAYNNNNNLTIEMMKFVLCLCVAGNTHTYTHTHTHTLIQTCAVLLVLPTNAQNQCGAGSCQAGQTCCLTGGSNIGCCPNGYYCCSTVNNCCAWTQKCNVNTGQCLSVRFAAHTHTHTHM